MSNACVLKISNTLFIHLSNMSNMIIYDGQRSGGPTRSVEPRAHEERDRERERSRERVKERDHEKSQERSHDRSRDREHREDRHHRTVIGSQIGKEIVVVVRHRDQDRSGRDRRDRDRYRDKDRRVMVTNWNVIASMTVDGHVTRTTSMTGLTDMRETGRRAMTVVIQMKCMTNLYTVIVNGLTRNEISEAMTTMIKSDMIMIVIVIIRWKKITMNQESLIYMTRIRIVSIRNQAGHFRVSMSTEGSSYV
ncbi:hypothetical protein R6Q59_005836 [Mikania micrantha]